MICKKDQEGLTRCKYEPPWLPDKLCCKACRWHAEASQNTTIHHLVFSKKGQLGTKAQGEFRGPFLLASHAACSFPGREMQRLPGCRVSFCGQSPSPTDQGYLWTPWTTGYVMNWRHPKDPQGRGRVAGVPCVLTTSNHESERVDFSRMIPLSHPWTPRPGPYKDISDVWENVRRHCKPVRVLVEQIVRLDDFGWLNWSVSKCQITESFGICKSRRWTPAGTITFAWVSCLAFMDAMICYAFSSHQSSWSFSEMP